MNPNIDVVPSTLDQAVEILYKGLSETDRTFIMARRPSEARETLGSAIRNSWSMGDATMPLATWFRRTLGVSRANDTSDLVLRSLWAKVRGEGFDLQTLVDEIKLHWTRQGEDP